MAEKQTSKPKSKPGGKAKTGQHQFQAETARLLHLMVHSVYSNREIFLRELISNAADACDKLRYEAVTAPELTADDSDLKITVMLDEKSGVLTVADNGIGMDERELIDNLGTIARSGTRAFLEQLEKDKKADISQIGQFGIGFYSAFMVADTIEVLSAKAGDDKPRLWSSDGSGTFSVTAPKKSDAAAVSRGTQVRLHLKKDAKEFLEAGRIEQIVRSYSDHVAVPIELIEIKDGKPEDPRQINTARALWMRPKKEIKPEQYNEFYGHVGGLFGEPAHIIHYRAEGRHEYSVLMFVPGEKPFDLFDPDRKGRTKLYVKRVFITDDAVILPPYLRFMRGVVDSEDMPLNISREMLQDNPIVTAIKTAVTNRVLSELGKLRDKQAEDYDEVWSNFGPVLKEGLYEDLEHRDKLLSLARFETTASNGGLRSLDDYVADMKDKQTAIYYLAGEDKDQIAASPHVEGFKSRGVEVLLLSDPVDSFWTTTATGFEGKPFKSITQGADDLAAFDEEKADDDKSDVSALATLIAHVKQTLGEEVSDVKRSHRLTDSAVCLVAAEGGLDKGLEKILARSKPEGMPGGAQILEINPDHSLIKALVAQSAKPKSDSQMADMAWLLYDLARILEGDPVAQAPQFAERLTKIMGQALEGD
jgi:molecular chaperone HtpG